MGKIIRRVLTIIPVAALQVLWYLLLMKWLAPYAPVIVSLLSAAAFFLVLFIIIKRDESAYGWTGRIQTAPEYPRGGHAQCRLRRAAQKSASRGRGA